MKCWSLEWSRRMGMVGGSSPVYTAENWAFTEKNPFFLVLHLRWEKIISDSHLKFVSFRFLTTKLSRKTSDESQNSPSFRSPSLCQSPSALGTLSCRTEQKVKHLWSGPHQISSGPDSGPPLTCTWAPRCVAVCPSSRLRCRKAAAAAGRSRRWSTCSWTEEAPPPGSFPARPPERTRATLTDTKRTFFWVSLLKTQWVCLKKSKKTDKFSGLVVTVCVGGCGRLTFRVSERWGDGAHSTSSWTSERGVPDRRKRNFS